MVAHRTARIAWKSSHTEESLLDTRRFAFGFDARFKPLLLTIGVTNGNSAVWLDDEQLDVRFGPWRLTTPTANLKDVQVSGPYRWYRAIGARGSLADRGVTFATNARAGACVRFHEPVGALFGPKLLRHPGATLTVADVGGFTEAVREQLER